MSGQSHERSLGISSIVYHQIVAVLGAFSLVLLVNNFFHLELRGVIAEAASVWGTVVRPAVKLLLDKTVIPLVLRVFHWHLNIPLSVRDYISCGLILMLSMVRVGKLYFGIEVLAGGFLSKLKRVFFVPLYLVGIILFWPGFVFFLIDAIIEKNPSGEKLEYEERLGILLIASPFLYLLLLLSANYLLPNK